MSPLEPHFILQDLIKTVVQHSSNTELEEYEILELKVKLI